MHAIEIHKGGRIIQNEWVYDEVAKKGQYNKVDITDDLKWIHKRDLACLVHQDVTLNDIFKIIALEPEIMDIMFCNCMAKALIEDWMQIKVYPQRIAGEDEIEYLELHWAPEVDEQSQLYGMSRPQFHGIGYELKEDHEFFKKGERIPWAIGCVELKNLLDLPIRLNESFDIKNVFSGSMTFTLHQVIESILWELSFYGNEEGKKNAREEIEMSYNEVVEQKSAPKVYSSLKEALNDGYINDGIGWK